MRPTMRSQPTINSSAGGLPVCLSGIMIHPRVQPSNRCPRLNHHHHRHETLRTLPLPFSRQNSIPALETEASETAALQQRFHAISLTESSAREDVFQEWPRHAVALQMAELDRRREAIRKHRSNRGSLANFMEEQRAVFDERHSTRMDAVINARMQDPAFQDELDEQLHRYRCAKAA